MKKNLRLRRNSDFTRVYRSGFRIYHQEFAIFGRKNGKPTNRYGFSLSKKLGNAVTRNRLKRQLREIVRLQEDRFPQGFDFIIMPNPTAIGKTYSELEEFLFRGVEIWKQKKEKKQKKNLSKEAQKKEETIEGEKCENQERPHE